MAENIKVTITAGGKTVQTDLKTIQELAKRHKKKGRKKRQEMLGGKLMGK